MKLNINTECNTNPVIEHVKVKYCCDKLGTTFTGSVIDDNGNIAYYLNGEFHRVDGPAIEHADGYKSWFLHGKRHRIDGYAIEYTDGSKRWYYNNELISTDPDYTVEEFHSALRAKGFKV